MPERNQDIEKAKGSTAQEYDDFGEIDMLLPKTRVAPRRAPGSTDTTEISFMPPVKDYTPKTEPPVTDSPFTLTPGKDDVIVRRVITPTAVMTEKKVEAPVIEYENEHSLVHRVRIFEWPNRYHYYRDFCRDAARYLHEEIADETPFVSVPFFSYVPQYSQLTSAQKECYFRWRSAFRKGQIYKVDESYLYLYVYEILNLAGHEIPSEEGLNLLYRIFHAYGTEHARLSRLLTEWICDYSLIFHLSVPKEERLHKDYTRTYLSTLKEFYISSPTDHLEGYTELLLRFCSAYDYRKSHFYNDANKAYFDRYLPGALSSAISEFSSSHHLFSETGMRDSHMVRNAFEQALCSYRIRYRIEVDYASFSRSHEMRYLVAAILKHTENRLRGLLGIKSRLSVYSLPTDVRKSIDLYCDENFPRKSTLAVKTARPEEIPAYEKLYDLPTTPLSIQHASEIELDSWETTRRLTEAFTDDVPEEKAEIVTMPPPVEAVPPIHPESSVEVSEEAEEVNFPCQLREWIPFLKAVRDHDPVSVNRILREKGMLPDLAADCINEIAADALGDVLLYEGDNGYEIYEDYIALLDD